MSIELRYLFSAYRLMILHICSMFHENISTVPELLRGYDFQYSKFPKGNNSIKDVGGVMVLDICTLSDDVLYLYKVS